MLWALLFASTHALLALSFALLLALRALIALLAMLALHFALLVALLVGAIVTTVTRIGTPRRQQ